MLQYPPTHEKNSSHTTFFIAACPTFIFILIVQPLLLRNMKNAQD